MVSVPGHWKKPGFGRTLVETPVQTPVFSPTVAPRRSQSSFNREGDTLIVTPSETISQTNQETQQVGIELKTFSKQLAISALYGFDLSQKKKIL